MSVISALEGDTYISSGDVFIDLEDANFSEHIAQIQFRFINFLKMNTFSDRLVINKKNIFNEYIKLNFFILRRTVLKTN